MWKQLYKGLEGTPVSNSLVPYNQKLSHYINQLWRQSPLWWHLEALSLPSVNLFWSVLWNPCVFKHQTHVRKNCMQDLKCIWYSINFTLSYGSYLLIGILFYLPFYWSLLTYITLQVWVYNIIIWFTYIVKWLTVNVV